MQTTEISYEEIYSFIVKMKENAFDVTYREFNHFNNAKILISYLSSISDELQVTLMINYLLQKKEVIDDSQLITLGNLSLIESLEQAKIALLSGLILFCDSSTNKCFSIENRKYPNRGISEPETEKSIRSSRDGFTESFLINIALIRRRIRDSHLNIKMYQFGNKTHVDVGLMYIDDLVNSSMLEFTTEKLSSIGYDTNILNERQLAEYVFNFKYNPYPLVRFSERVDIVAIHLLQGKFILVIDNSPSVIILPTTFFEQCKQIEEYSQTNWIGTMLVLLRFTGVALSLYLLPIWCILVALEYIGIGILYVPTIDSLHIFCLQVILCDLIVEFLRLAMIHSPTILTGVIGIVAAFILGQMSIDIGYFTSEIVLYVALANMGTFVTPGYELSMANKFSRVLIIGLIFLFSYIGGIVGIIVHILFLANIKSGEFHYLYPLYPFDFDEFKRVFLRFKTISINKNK